MSHTSGCATVNAFGCAAVPAVTPEMALESEQEIELSDADAGARGGAGGGGGDAEGAGGSGDGGGGRGGDDAAATTSDGNINAVAARDGCVGAAEASGGV